MNLQTAYISASNTWFNNVFSQNFKEIRDAHRREAGRYTWDYRWVQISSSFRHLIMSLLFSTLLQANTSKILGTRNNN